MQNSKMSLDKEKKNTKETLASSSIILTIRERDTKGQSRREGVAMSHTTPLYFSILVSPGETVKYDLSQITFVMKDNGKQETTE